MIRIIKGKNYQRCTCCLSLDDVTEVQFINKASYSKAVALCADCRNELEGMIELYKLRQKGDGHK